MATSLFLSPHRSLHGSGVAERIETPAHDAGRLQADVAAALRRARVRGNPHPVALGAIPFDTRQPSALVVPVVSEFVERGDVVRGEAADLPPILHTQSIPGEERFKQGVRQAVANFGLSDIRKAVLSRLLDVELAGHADAGDIFRRLVSRNPSGFQFRTGGRQPRAAVA
jgi:isochorismate synthase